MIDIEMISGVSVIRMNHGKVNAIESAQDFATIPAAVFAMTKRQLRAPAERNIILGEAEFDKSINQIWFSDANRQMIEEFVATRL